MISALQPIVNDLLVVRGGVNKGEGGKDLDTQREVIVAMLFKLLPYHEVGFAPWCSSTSDSVRVKRIVACVLV